jgi:hypothetical protein
MVENLSRCFSAVFVAVIMALVFLSMLVRTYEYSSLWLGVCGWWAAYHPSSLCGRLINGSWLVCIRDFVRRWRRIPMDLRVEAFRIRKERRRLLRNTVLFRESYHILSLDRVVT